MKPRLRPLLLVACLAIGGLGATLFAACIPSYTFGESGSSDGGGNDSTTSSGSSSGSSGASSGGSLDGSPGTEGGGSSSSGGSDGSTDASKIVINPLDASTPFAIATTGSKVASTGYGYQVHVIYAVNDGRYWLFYADDTPNVIRTRVSSDFVNWTDGASINLASGYSVSDGYNFSVAYADVGGADVVHMAVDGVDITSSSYQAYHVRATIAGGAISAAAPVPHPNTNNGSSCPQDGPATAIAGDGHVWDVTAWTSHGSTACDTDVYVSPGAEVGSGWNTGSFSYDGYFVSVPSYAFVHDLMGLTDAGLVLALWPDEDEQGTTVFDSIGWGVSSSFNGNAEVFPDASAELFNGAGTIASLNDWTACRLTASDVRVLRHDLTGGQTDVSSFEELQYDGSTWTSVAAPAAVTSASNNGVVLVSDTNPAHGMVLATIGTDNKINLARWTSANGWTSLASLPATTTRQSISGSGCGSVRPSIFWIEGIGSPYTIMEADLSGLLLNP